MKYAHRHVVPFGLLLFLTWCCVVTAVPAKGQTIKKPDQPVPTLNVDDVRIGMKGYGMTVFHGTKIEPFRVEVVSIMPNSTPTHSVIWVLCPDARMKESGPVQGMSGSPIYLWEDGEPQVPGKGGKLIGAFAFGYSYSQECLVGVQPIQYMRDAATRAPKDDKAEQANGARHGSARGAINLIESLDRLPQMQNMPAMAKVRNEAILDMMRRAAGKSGAPSSNNDKHAMVSGPEVGSQASAMMLPITLGSARGAEMFGPLLRSKGLLALAGDAGPVGGAPPKSVDPKSVALQPGSVLAIPLAYGDIDMSASGTVTDVLPNGEVLAFGHPMFGLGKARVPMATGYTHFVMPRRSISFKNSGSLTMMGTLVRDEGSAVVGVPEVRYTTAPVTVTVNMPNDASRTYHYHLVNEPSLSPVLMANLALSSVEAIYGVPIESTMRVRANLKFAGDREVDIDTLIPQGNSAYAASELLPPVSVLVDNPYDSLDITSANVTVDIEDGVREARIANGRLEQAQVAPGDKVNVLLDLIHYGGRQERRKVTFQLPEDLDEGDYTLTLSGADVFARMKQQTQPYLLETSTVDDLVSYLQLVSGYRTDKLYAALQLTQPSLAVGRTEMADLPSSRAAILTSPTRTDVVTFPRMLDQTYDADAVIVGQIGFTINVRKP